MGASTRRLDQKAVAIGRCPAFRVKSNPWGGGRHGRRTAAGPARAAGQAGERIDTGGIGQTVIAGGQVARRRRRKLAPILAVPVLSALATGTGAAMLK